MLSRHSKQFIFRTDFFRITNCFRLQQINKLEITPDKQHLATASYQHIRMYDLTSNNPNAVLNYEGILFHLSRS